MKYKYVIFIYLISVFLNPTLSSQEVSENKISLELNKLFFIGRDIKETNQTYHNENAYHYYKRYNEENSFLEINLREIIKENNYFSHYNIIDFISKPQFEIMDKLLAKNISDIFTFLDEDSQRFFYYRLFENKNFKNEKCLIFVTGHEKGKNNFYNKIINGVGCSTEFEFKKEIISKILDSIHLKY
jgi:hypothetical protein